MSAYSHINQRNFKYTILKNTIIGILLVGTWVLSGCGAYRTPTGSTMPGQPPKPYPAQHRKG
jgi:hypothetical protein